MQSDSVTEKKGDSTEQREREYAPEESFVFSAVFITATVDNGTRRHFLLHRSSTSERKYSKFLIPVSLEFSLFLLMESRETRNLLNDFCFSCAAIPQRAAGDRISSADDQWSVKWPLQTAIRKFFPRITSMSTSSTNRKSFVKLSDRREQGEFHWQAASSSRRKSSNTEEFYYRVRDATETLVPVDNHSAGGFSRYPFSFVELMQDQRNLPKMFLLEKVTGSSSRQEEDSYLMALQHSRLPCQRLVNPDDCRYTAPQRRWQPAVRADAPVARHYQRKNPTNIRHHLENQQHGHHGNGNDRHHSGDFPDSCGLYNYPLEQYEDDVQKPAAFDSPSIKLIIHVTPLN